MNRCSRVSDTAVCGRALTLLATMFPLSEKSAVNLRGHYNLSNTTTFADHEDASGSAVADFKLYTKFWGLQKYLSRAYDVEDSAVRSDISRIEGAALKYPPVLVEFRILKKDIPPDP